MVPKDSKYLSFIETDIFGRRGVEKYWSSEKNGKIYLQLMDITRYHQDEWLTRVLLVITNISQLTMTQNKV